MAFCKNCGTLMENDVCPNCGTTNEPVDSTPAPEAQPVYAAPAEPQPTYTAPQQPATPPQPPYTPPQQPYGYQPPYYPPQKPAAEPVSTGGWIWRSLLAHIPFVGWIIYLVMLFVWMGDESKEESFRNWAKAQLILLAIAVGLVVLFFFLIAPLVVAIGNMILAN